MSYSDPYAGLLTGLKLARLKICPAKTSTINICKNKCLADDKWSAIKNCPINVQNWHPNSSQLTILTWVVLARPYISYDWNVVFRSFCGSVPFAGLLAGLKIAGFSLAKCPAKSHAKKWSAKSLSQTLKFLPARFTDFCPAMWWFKHLIQTLSKIGLRLVMITCGKAGRIWFKLSPCQYDAMPKDTQPGNADGVVDCASLNAAALRVSLCQCDAVTIAIRGIQPQSSKLALCAFFV